MLKKSVQQDFLSIQKWCLFARPYSHGIHAVNHNPSLSAGVYLSTRGFVVAVALIFMCMLSLAVVQTTLTAKKASVFCTANLAPGKLTPRSGLQVTSGVSKLEKKMQKMKSANKNKTRIRMSQMKSSKMATFTADLYVPC